MATQGRRPMLVPGGAAALTGCVCLGAAGVMLKQGARAWGTLGWLPWAAIVVGLALFVVAGVQGRRASTKKQAPLTRSALQKQLIVASIGVIAFAPLAAFGGYLLHQRDSGPHVPVTVKRCEIVDPGPQRGASPHDYCVGDWTLEGRSYVGKRIQGAGVADEGEVIDATIHGDVAYSRDLQTPLILLGVFGAGALLAAWLFVATWRQWRNSR